MYQVDVASQIYALQILVLLTQRAWTSPSIASRVLVQQVLPEKLVMKKSMSVLLSRVRMEGLAMMRLLALHVHACLHTLEQIVRPHYNHACPIHASMAHAMITETTPTVVLVKLVLPVSYAIRILTSVSPLLALTMLPVLMALGTSLAPVSLDILVALAMPI